MFKNHGDRKQRFSFRKLSVGLVSALVGTYFMVSSPVLQGHPVQAHVTEQVGSVCGQVVNYQYLLEAELTSEERTLVVEALPNLAQANDDTYYLVYRPKQMSQVVKSLPKSGDDNSLATLLMGLGAGLVLLAIKRRSNGKAYLHSLIVLTTLGASVVTYDALAERTSALSQFNQTLSVCVGEQLPAPANIDGFEYVGYLRKEKAPVEVSDNGKNEAKDSFESLGDNVKPSETLEVSKSSDNPPMAEEKPTAKIDKKEEVESTVLPFETQYVEDATLPFGKEVVRQAGVNGSLTTTYEVVVTLQ